MIHSRVLGVGSYLPERILTNADFEKMVDTSDTWILERTGIRERHIAAENETASLLGMHAAKKAIEMADIDPETIDMILVASCTNERVFPSAACALHAHLGLQNNAPAMDISAACTGFLYALSVADQYIRQGTYQTILVVGAEVLTRMVDYTDRTTCVLFGDGAGAFVLGASETPGIHSTHLHSQGLHQDLLYMPNHTMSHLERDQSMHLKMKGNDVFKHAVRSLESAVDEALAFNQITKEDIDWLIPHQANLRIINGLAKKLGLPLEKAVVTVEKHGNTSSASIPLAMDEAVRDGRIQRGDRLLLESFGGGFTWGSAYLTF